MMEFLHELHSRNLSNKQTRFQAYREASHSLEYHARKRLPPCVEEGIKALFPDEQYVRFAAK